MGIGTIFTIAGTVFTVLKGGIDLLMNYVFK